MSLWFYCQERRNLNCEATIEQEMSWTYSLDELLWSNNSGTIEYAWLLVALSGTFSSTVGLWTKHSFMVLSAHRVPLFNLVWKDCENSRPLPFLRPLKSMKKHSSDNTFNKSACFLHRPQLAWDHEGPLHFSHITLHYISLFNELVLLVKNVSPSLIPLLPYNLCQGYKSILLFFSSSSSSPCTFF